MSEHRRLVLLIGVLFCFLVQLPGRDRLAKASPSNQVLLFKDGSRLLVRHYEIRGDVVVLTAVDGTLLSVNREFVDLEATEQVNLGRTGETASGSGEGILSRDPPIVNTEATKNGVATTGFDGPPPPNPPEVISRNDRGQATLRAVRLSEPLIVDGRLEDPVYRRVPAAKGFIQQEPVEGDVFMLAGSQSIFQEKLDSEILNRYQKFDISSTASLYGKGADMLRLRALEIENQVYQDNPEICQCLLDQGVKRQMRALRIIVRDFSFQYDPGKKQLRLKAVLPRGCYFTSLLVYNFTSFIPTIVMSFVIHKVMSILRS